jgi:iron complex outermembrane receptor protein
MTTTRPTLRRVARVASCVLALAVPLLARCAPSSHAEELRSSSAVAQATSPPPAPSPSPDLLLLEPVTVTADKRRELVQDVPASVSVVGEATIEDAGIDKVKQASYYVPNLFISEFTAAKLSFPFVRGVGGGSLNPAVTTYYDGVPQLNANSSSIELLDIERIEFLRGPQGTLYGRNTLGGVINVLSRKPSFAPAAEVSATGGNYALQDYRATVDGPLVDGFAAGNFSIGYVNRNGYTKNTVTGHDLDSRNDVFGRTALLLTPGDDWEVVGRVWAEHDGDGDYALGDLAGLREHPFEVSRNLEGFTRRDLVGSSVVASNAGPVTTFTSVTGFVYWQTDDLTDLDYTPVDLLARRNQENEKQFTQEFRLASSEGNPAQLNDVLTLSWVTGTFIFASNYQEDAANDYRLAAAEVGASFPFQEKNVASLGNAGFGLFGQTTLTAWQRLDATLGLRYDFERDDADLHYFTSPPVTSPIFGPPVNLNEARTFDAVTPRFALAYHVTPAILPYASIARGYKAGGFNPTAPSGAASFGSETTWSYEVGVKSGFFDERVTLDFDLFDVDWQNLQLDVPNPQIPGRFFTANAGDATTRGVEVELRALVQPGWSVFSAFGYNDPHFDSGSHAEGQDVGGNVLPYAPQTTWTIGTELVRDLGSGLTFYGRAEANGYGHYFYDATNAQSQASYFLADFRAGLAGVRPLPWRVDGWVRNALGENYIPLAFPFPLAPSGYVGEMGAPRTFGVTVSVGL